MDNEPKHPTYGTLRNLLAVIEFDVREGYDVRIGLQGALSWFSHEFARRRVESGSAKEGAMTNLEMTKLCARAMYLEVVSTPESPVVRVWDGKGRALYDPLHDDAQAMALVKKFPIKIGRTAEGFYAEIPKVVYSPFADLNRAIVSCVAHIAAQGGLTKP